MDNGLVYQVEFYESEFKREKDQYLWYEAKKIDHLLEIMKSYTHDRTMYPLLADLLLHYLKDVQERMEEERQKSP